MIYPDSLQEIKIIKQTERQKIVLVEDMNGVQYLKRVFDADKRELYKSLKKINHPNIPQIYYIGFDESTTIIEEYVSGTSLSTLLACNKKFSSKQIYTIVKQVLSALEVLHNSKIIHRDVKPDNILIDESNHLWLIDYDIARIHRDEKRKDTETLGTFGYAPIEQYGMLPTDYKTDIYAFGVTLKALLDSSNNIMALRKISSRCTKLDPEQRYQKVSAIKRAIFVRKFMPLLLLFLSIIALCFSYYFINYYATNHESENYHLQDKNQSNLTVSTDSNEKTEPETGVVQVDEETIHLIRFVDFEITDTLMEYGELENINTTLIFNDENLRQYLSFMEDMENNGTILLGKNHGTPVDAELSLANGIFSISLEDKLGHSFSHQFSYDKNHPFQVLYPENRRINAEMVCHDMDGDGVEELLIGICDCSMTVTETSIYQYFNYSLGWVLRYDEARGFILCDGNMFSENSKFALFENDLRVYLPHAAKNTEDKHGYELEDNNILPFL